MPKSLKKVVITGGSSIADHAFYKCTGLVEVVVSDSVTSIGTLAFFGCSGLEAVTFEEPTGWYTATMIDAAFGVEMVLTDPAQNATYVASAYSRYYWYRHI